MLRGHLLMLEAETPGIDQRRHGDVESTLRLTRHFHRLREHLDEIGIERHLTVLVDSRDHRLLVERRERTVNLHQLFTDSDTKIGVALVDDLISCAKHKVGDLTVRHRALMTDNQHRADNQQHKKWQLPDQFLFLFLIHDDQISMITLKVPPIFVS